MSVKRRNPLVSLQKIILSNFALYSLFEYFVHVVLIVKKDVENVRIYESCGFIATTVVISICTVLFFKFRNSNEYCYAFI